MPSSPSGAEARVLVTDIKPNIDQLTLEEVKQIIGSIREKIRILRAEEERKRREKSDFDEKGELRKKPAFRKSKAPLENPGNWLTHFSVRDGVKNEFEDRHKKSRALQPTAIHAIALKWQQGRPIHTNHIRPSVWEFLYSREFAREIRTRALRLLEKGVPPEDQKNWKSEKERPKNVTLYAMEAIREFLAEHEMGTFEDFIDENGYFVECASQETLEDMYTIFRQLRVQNGFKDPAILLETLARHQGGRTDVELRDIMAKLEDYRADNPNGFRPAITHNCAPIISVGQDLYDQIKESYLRCEGPRADWSTLAQIKARHNITSGDAAMRRMVRQCLEGEDEVDHSEIRKTTRGHKAKFYSPDLEAKIAEMAREKGFIK